MLIREPIIVICGPACTGKSTFARILAESESRELIIHDDVLTEMKPDSDRNSEDRLDALIEMHMQAVALVSAGLKIVLEGTYSRAQYRSHLISTFQDIPLCIAQVRTPAEVAVERFTHRKNHPGIDLTAQRVEQLNREYPYSELVTVIDGMQTFIEQYKNLQTTMPLTQSEIKKWVSQGLPNDHASQ